MLVRLLGVVVLPPLLVLLALAAAEASTQILSKRLLHKSRRLSHVTQYSLLCCCLRSAYLCSACVAR